MSLISDVFSYAVKMGVVADNPCAKVTIPKGEQKEKQIYTPDEVERFLTLLNSEPLKYGDKWVETDRLYTKWNGEPMQNGTLYFWLNEFCDKHGLPFYGIHSFRHLFASLLVNQGVDIVTVSGALGHSTVSKTSSIYCHMLQEAQAKVSDAVSSALNFGNKKEPKAS